MDLDRLYLDFNATSPLSESVKSWLKSGDFCFANPSSQHHLGKSSRKIINDSINQILNFFSIDSKKYNLFFHSGATESISTFAYSFSEWSRQSHRNLLICYSDLDHPAVTSLGSRFFGHHVSFFKLNINHNLEYDHIHNLEKIKEFKSKDPDLLILYHHLWVHNESGVVSPLADLTIFKSIPDLYLHIDAVQAPGKIPEWNLLDCGDIFTFSCHKFGALKGTSFSFYSKQISFYPMITGGGQQIARSGTENALGIKTIVLALEDLKGINYTENMRLKKDLEHFIQAELGHFGAIVSSKGKAKSCNTIYFYFYDLSSDITLALFDLNGLMLSAGSACSSGTAKSSPLLMHLGLEKFARNGLRLSFGFSVSEVEIRQLKKSFQQVMLKVRQNAQELT